MKKKILLVVIFALILSSCNAKSESKEKKLDNGNIEKTEDVDISKEDIDIDEKNQGEKSDVKDDSIEKEISLNYDEIRPNELGRVMVIMYHSLQDKEAQFVSTPEIFRSNLERLHKLGYVSVSLSDFVSNNMNVPAGKTPVVLTFDDGHSSNFKVSEKNGEITIDPKCAVGILDDFYEKNPDFGKEATFFLNGHTPFAQEEYVKYKLNYLIEEGYDIGNHSYGHENFTKISKENLQETLGKNKNQIEDLLENKNYTVNTLALPFGSRPASNEVEEYVYKGSFADKVYEHIAVLNVGWNPTYSPVHKKFNYKSINRVQAGSMDQQLNDWIDYLEENSSQKYISDGIKNQITFPKSWEKHLKDNIDIEKFKIETYERK